MTIAFIGLGSNLGDPIKQAQQAIIEINHIQDTQVITCSPFYRSKPLGPKNQDDFLNAVIKLSTKLSAFTLLHQLQKIEIQLGRVRKSERFGPRTLDLDILLYGNEVINTQELTIPHYDIQRREFFLYPLFDLEPELIFPDGLRLNQLIDNTPLNGMTYW